MKWSAAHNSFFYHSDIPFYAAAGWDLSDCIDVHQSIFDEFKSSPPGKVRAVDSNGMPCWIDEPPPPPLSKEELVAQAELQKQSLIIEVTREINTLADAATLEMAMPHEVARCTALRKYRVELNRVDTSTAPDITWPLLTSD